MGKNKTKSNEAIDDVFSTETTQTKINLKDTSENPKIDDGVLIKVKSNVIGNLIYINSRTKEQTEWLRCGEIQELTFGDLRAMKATQSSFFINQWIIILGVSPNSNCNIKTADIYKLLGITKYYMNLVDPTKFDEICNWSDKEIVEKIELMSDNAKNNLKLALSEYIKHGILDSKKKISMFEKVLNFTFEE